MSITFRHFGIVVSNLEKAVKLYCNYLGCRIIKEYFDLTGNYQNKLVGIDDVRMNIAVLRTEDNVRIELLEYKNHPGAKRRPVRANDIGASHFALTVQDIDDLYQNRYGWDVVFISKPLLSPDGYVKVAYAILMDECIVELVQVLDNRAKLTGGDG